MKRAYLFILLLISLGLAGVVLGQGVLGGEFAVVQQIGQVRPRGILYDANFDQIALTTPQGQLALVNAANFETRHILYTSGPYSAYEFSHDGQYLAVAIDIRVDLWDTQNGEQVASFSPDGALSIRAPLMFSYDDGLLLVNATVRAPSAIRRSENDTTNLPWLWDVSYARREGSSTLPRSVEATNFLDFRNGFVLGPNRIVIAALPQRLQVIDVGNTDFPILGEIESTRAERDPISVWYSERGDMMYVRPQGRNTLIQINTLTGEIVDLQPGRDLNYSNMDILEHVGLTDQTRIIGEPGSTLPNSFLEVLFGSGYNAAWSYHPITVTLIDILDPITVGEEERGLLVYIFDEQTGRGVIEFLRPQNVTHIVLHPDNRRLMLQRTFAGTPIEIYDLVTGNREHTYYPVWSDPDGRYLLDFNSDGRLILSDFQRIDVESGEVLYENLHYAPSLGQYSFSDDSRSLITIDGSRWWEWDIETGQVIRREAVNLRGNLVDFTPDGDRFLSQIDGPGMEIVDIGTGERHSVFFENRPNTSIAGIYPSPNWENFIVVYAADSFSQHYPGNEIALYNLYDGLQWFIAGEDMPSPENREYGWIDDQTAYVFSLSRGGQPARVYGVDYHASGLPQCLVDAFPETWTRWLDLWERLNARMSATSLNRLSLTLCDTLPADETGIDAVLFPSQTPTLLPVTATPSIIAGVPACLTNRFSDEAQQYARNWREIIAGLTDDEAAEMAVLICESLTGSSSPSRVSSGSATQQIMTVDMATGQRNFSSFFPPVEGPPRRSLEIIIDEFRRLEGFTPELPLLSPDGTLLATLDFSGHIVIYRLVTPYEVLEANATSTAVVEAEEPNIIGVRPTFTPTPFNAGQPRPTFTPTITPTAPPMPTQLANQPNLGDILEYCPIDNVLYTRSDPAPDYAPPGSLYMRPTNSSTPYVWIYDPVTGNFYPDDTLPGCGVTTQCDFSFDQNWILTITDAIRVSRVDGSESTELFSNEEQALWPFPIYWLNNGQIEFAYSEYVPDESLQPQEFIRRFDPATRSYSEPFERRDPISINQLPTEVISLQPDNGPIAVVRTSFNAGRGLGYRYFVYNQDTGETDYFARITGGELFFEWHPLGTALYYGFGGTDNWNIYDPATGEHRLLGELPSGIWSRDGQLRIDWYTPPSDVVRERREAGLPIPQMRVWNSTTGQQQHYCLPESMTGDHTRFVWSPDNRYVIFTNGVQIPSEILVPTTTPGAPTPPPVPQEEISRTRTHFIILDTQTGHFTTLGEVNGEVIVWTQGEAR